MTEQFVKREGRIERTKGFGMKIIPGIVSVTFRNMAPDDLVRLAQQANLKAVEWGGDRHVPHGDVARAEQIRRMTEDAGLAVAAYGSYYRVGCDGKGSPGFGPVLETAVALGAPAVRVWAGDKPSSRAGDSWWDLVITETRRIAELAGQAGLSIAFEYHGNTLNDTIDGARRLFRGIERDNVFSYWQSDPALSVRERLRGLKLLRRRLSNVHVFYWFEGARRPLADGEEEWNQYLHVVAETERDHFALLEFVQDDLPPYLIRDAATLISMIKGL